MSYWENSLGAFLHAMQRDAFGCHAGAILSCMGGRGAHFGKLIGSIFTC
jgi:hypothetical protein